MDILREEINRDGNLEVECAELRKVNTKLEQRATTSKTKLNDFDDVLKDRYLDICMIKDMLSTWVILRSCLKSARNSLGYATKELLDRERNLMRKL